MVEFTKLPKLEMPQDVANNETCSTMWYELNEQIGQLNKKRVRITECFDKGSLFKVEQMLYDYLGDEIATREAIDDWYAESSLAIRNETKAQEGYAISVQQQIAEKLKEIGFTNLAFAGEHPSCVQERRRINKMQQIRTQLCREQNNNQTALNQVRRQLQQFENRTMANFMLPTKPSAGGIVDDKDTGVR